MPILQVTPFPEAEPPYVLIETEAPTFAWTEFSVTRNGAPVRVPPGAVGSESFYFLDYDAPFGEELVYELRGVSGGWNGTEEETWDDLSNWTTSGDGSWGVADNKLVLLTNVGGSPMLTQDVNWDVDRLDIAGFGITSGDPGGFSRDYLYIGNRPGASYLTLTRTPGDYSRLVINQKPSGSIGADIFSGLISPSAVLSFRKSGDNISIFADGVVIATSGVSWDSIQPLGIQFLSFNAPAQPGRRAGILTGYVGFDPTEIVEQSTVTLNGKGAWLYHAYDPLLALRLDGGDGSCSDLFTTVDVARSLSRDTNTTLLRPLGSTRDIAVSTGPRRDPAWSMEIGTKTAAAYDQVELFLADDSPVRMEYDGSLSDVPSLCAPGMRIPRGWHSPGSVTEVRDIDNWESPLRRWQMSLDPVRPPTIPPVKLIGFGLTPFGIFGFGDDS